MIELRVSRHPLVQSYLARLRDAETSSAEFRRLAHTITQLLAYEATADLPLRDIEIQTPMSRARFQTLDARIAIVPILRAGLSMADVLLDLLPDAQVWHIGLYRDETTLQPHAYYSRLPQAAAVDIGLVVDPMLATGGSALHACRLLREIGIPRIKLITLIAAPEGVARLQTDLPDLQIHTGALDDRLNEIGYIVPGLGDAGDRLFGTSPAHPSHGGP